MKIVGQVSTTEEAKEFENIIRLFIVNGRIKKLAYQSKEESGANSKQIRDNTLYIYSM